MSVNIAPSLSASARTMNISELRLGIFQLIDIDIDIDFKKTLLALALTCTSFTGMALDLLWQDLDDFTPLIRCLPQSLLHQQQLDFQRTMNADDWSIFCKYNYRVHSLVMKKMDVISLNIWNNLHSPPCSSPLLPNLTSVTCRTFNGLPSFISLIVPRQLTTFKFFATEFCPHRDIESTLSHFSILCPSVSHFYLYGKSSVHISTALKCWSHLLSARTGIISDAAILHLAGLPSFRELRLELHPTPIAAETRGLLQYPAFCALRVLSVTCRSLPPLDAFFEMLSIAPEMLSIFFKPADSAPTFSASMAHISNACAHGALEELRVYVIGNISLSTSIDAATFLPFCAFPNLRTFYLHSPIVQLGDSTLLRMAKAWPHLRDLVINGKNVPASDNIAVNAFISLLQHCPNLTSVVIAIDWSAVDKRHGMSMQIPYQGFTHETLSRADFCTSRIRYAKSVAAFISAITPKLKDVIGQDFAEYHNRLEHGTFAARWNTVNRLVKASFKVHAQERRKMFNAGGTVGDPASGAVGEDPDDDSGMENDDSETESDDSEMESDGSEWRATLHSILSKSF